MQRRAWTAILVAVVALVGAATTAAAQDPETTNTTFAVPEGAVQIGDGYSFTGATVFSPDGSTREMDAYQAAVFVQSWLGRAFFASEDIVKDPPPELPVHRVDIEGGWHGPVGRLTVYFATDGTTPYIAFPQTQDIVTDPAAAPPEPADWFVAPPRVIDAFNGEAELIETTGTQQAAADGGDPGDQEDDDGPPWAGVAIIAAIVVALGAYTIRALRSR